MTAEEAFRQFAQLVDLHHEARGKHEQAYTNGADSVLVASLYRETVEVGERASKAFGLFLTLADEEDMTSTE